MKFLALLVALCPFYAASVAVETAEESRQFDIDFMAAMSLVQDQARPHTTFEDDNSDIGRKDDKEEPDSVCWDELGCFDRSIGDRLPVNPDDIPPTYLMFSGNKPGVYMSWNDTIEDLQNKTKGYFDEERRFILLAHGFGESLGKAWIWNLKNATVKAYPDANVIIIDWGKGAFLPLYNRAASNVPLIANMTVRLTTKLMKINPTIKAKNIYFIGFSLGAQMSGYYARSFSKQTNTKIGRITSLDAAAPLFADLKIAPRKGDADFVEAIHTSAGDNIITGKVGYIPPYADIDFYPNGGIKQPGCSIFRIPCSHQRAFVYLTHAFEDLASCQFKGVRCASVEEANNANCTGPAVDAHIGQKDIENYHRFDKDFHIVYLKTDSKAPFCLAEKKN